MGTSECQRLLVTTVMCIPIAFSSRTREPLEVPMVLEEADTRFYHLLIILSICFADKNSSGWIDQLGEYLLHELGITSAVRY